MLDFDQVLLSVQITSSNDIMPKDGSDIHTWTSVTQRKVGHGYDGRTKFIPVLQRIGVDKS